MFLNDHLSKTVLSLFCENMVKIEDLLWRVPKASTLSQKCRKKGRDKRSDLLICRRVLIECSARASDCLGLSGRSIQSHVPNKMEEIA